MDHSSFQAYFEEMPVIAILRGIKPEDVKNVCSALIHTGIKLLEIPLNRPDALECIQTASSLFGNEQCIGAGTVLTSQQTVQVYDHGGSFIISPNTDIEVIEWTNKLGMTSIPGFLSPTEAFCALKAGADYLKFFPSKPLGLSYLKLIRTVISAPILAVGGIDTGNANDFMKYCDGIGIGSALYRPDCSLDEITESASQFVENMKFFLQEKQEKSILSR